MLDQTIETEDRPTLYHPPVEKVLSCGSTCVIGRLRKGVILKSPRCHRWKASDTVASAYVQIVKKSFSVEQQILEIIGEHPRITRYSRCRLIQPFADVNLSLGTLAFPMAQRPASSSRLDSDGTLQEYLEDHNDTISIDLRMKWHKQSLVATCYIHERGVIHSDLRPENFLLHITGNSTLDHSLCEFGGSVYMDIDS